MAEWKLRLDAMTTMAALEGLIKLSPSSSATSIPLPDVAQADWRAEQGADSGRLPRSSRGGSGGWLARLLGRWGACLLGSVASSNRQPGCLSYNAPGRLIARSYKGKIPTPGLAFSRRSPLPLPLPSPLPSPPRRTKHGDTGARGPSPQQVFGAQIYCFARPQAHAVRRRCPEDCTCSTAIQFAALGERHPAAAPRPPAQPAPSRQTQHPTAPARPAALAAQVW